MVSSGRRAEPASRPPRSVEAGALARALSGSVLTVALLTGTFGALVRDALAQDVMPPSAMPPSAGGEGEGSGDLSPSGALSATSDSSLPPQARLIRAKGFVGSIERSSQSIMRQLQVARQDRDVVRVLCLSDKLNQVDVASRSAQDRLGALEVAVGRGDADRARHEYTVLEVLNDRVRVLVNESNQCVGEETGFIGEAEVSVSIDPNLPDAETGFGPSDYSPPPLPNISSPIE